MVSVGIDIATHTGMARVEGEDVRSKTIHFPKERGFIRLHMIAAEVDRTLDLWRPDVVAIEAYAFVRNVDSYTTLVECGTVIKQMVYRRKLTWAEVPPTVLKQWTTGSGRASKEEMAAAALAKWGFKSTSHDAVDAFALAKMAQLGAAGMGKLVGVQIFN
jgi:Holliday junction resolvasome RuvABC endonuclease subunit